MQGLKRKLVYVGGYEVIGFLVGTAVMTALTGSGPATTAPLAIMIATVASLWNMAFNYLFEAWERRQASRERTVGRRVLHAVSFQLTLVCFLIPLIAWWLEITLLQALLLDLVFIVYIPFYTFGYNWAFDKVFGLPSSAIADPVPDADPVREPHALVANAPDDDSQRGDGREHPPSGR
ncbi:PACE efflux transporter [Nocardiopsis sp. L17-MgMaSL7]|uniref:PACE efflux transporter n=1 Tax=Nocardiopsis sp. L17-MgMaSL7 TaxID=1938893 RepID=UPI000D70B139|nr:PACE efflux transporter [Nocardiopsis sp. L17-MgMaSL7]PWV55380.1 putative membrane protein [Nocardiopsis sp. L17-MgMaSL7]